jgi:hypothetical protein
MHLVQILLPLYDNEGNPFARKLYDEVRAVLTERLGGVTEYRRSPASGLWKEEEGNVVQDDIIIYETMDPDLDRPWWRDYRERLRVAFRQEELVVRAIKIEAL